MADWPKCDYCGKDTERCIGSDIYPHRRDLDAKTFYRCVPCRAWVGCHPGTNTPLGRLANAELRQAKQAAHAAFDPLWKRKAARDGIGKGKARGLGYRWLAAQLGIPAADCHIGMMDAETCRRVVRVCNGAVRRDVE